jgi:hypothetical protein
MVCIYIDQGSVLDVWFNLFLMVKYRYVMFLRYLETIS